MLNTNPQAQTLNDIIRNDSPTVFSLLSDHGKAAFLPKEGILAQSALAEGKKINATIGIATDDHNIPLYLNSLHNHVSLDPNNIYPYAPSSGLPKLREFWNAQLKLKNPTLSGKQFSKPVVTAGITHSLYIAGYLFINENEQIISPDLFWGNYQLIFESNFGAKLTTFPIFKNRKFNTEGLSELLNTSGTKKIVLLNFPNNPTGYTPTKDEAKSIVDILVNAAKSGKEILVLLDDAYFGLVYEDNIEKESLFSYLCDAHKNILTIKLDGATKEDYVWGLRTAFITYGGYKLKTETYGALEQKTTGAIRSSISSASHLSQTLLVSAYNSDTYEEEKKKLYSLLMSRYQMVVNIFKENSKYKEYFTPFPYNSGYFMCISLNKSIDADKVRQTLLEKYDTGVISLDNNIRIAFSAVSSKFIPELFENIYLACKYFSKS